MLYYHKSARGWRDRSRGSCAIILTVFLCLAKEAGEGYTEKDKMRVQPFAVCGGAYWWPVMIRIRFVETVVIRRL
jgi:hypothetical protein